ncbi:MAG TPA: hypothetical protein VH415_03080 [Nitrososphaeraceae archaeon]|jgi:hypothetical protein
MRTNLGGGGDDIIMSPMVRSEKPKPNLEKGKREYCARHNLFYSSKDDGCFVCQQEAEAKCSGKENY